MNSDYTDELTALVTSAVDDIIHDHVNYDRPVKTEIKTKELEVLEVGTDDGTAYGGYRIIVNGGQFIIDLDASGYFSGFTDCWDNASESHYTRDVHFDELQEFEYHVTNFREFNDAAIDNAVDNQIESSKEK